MKKIKLFFVLKQHNKGQAFMEMAILIIFLLIMVLGMVEFGNLLNQYISLVDGAREGARFGSNNDPFYDEIAKKDIYGAPQESFFTKIDTIVEGTGKPDDAGAIAPIILNYKKYPDDVVISFISVRTGGSYITYGPWSSHKKQLTSKILDDPDFISGSLDSAAPNTGILIVEIFYNYEQIMNSPIFTMFVPNPIPVHAYAVMPLSGAEPTPVVGP